MYNGAPYLALCSPPSRSARCSQRQLRYMRRTHALLNAPTPTPGVQAETSRPTWSTPARPSRHCASCPREPATEIALHGEIALPGESGASAVRDAPALAAPRTPPPPPAPRSRARDPTSSSCTRGGTTGKPEGVTGHVPALRLRGSGLLAASVWPRSRHTRRTWFDDLCDRSRWGRSR